MYSVPLKLPPLTFPKTSERKPKNFTPIHQIDVNRLIKLPPIDPIARKTNQTVPWALIRRYRKKNRLRQDNSVTKRPGPPGAASSKGVQLQISPRGNFADDPYENSYFMSYNQGNNPNKKDLHKAAAQNETMLSQGEIKEYAFLNQAKSINIFELKDEDDEANDFEAIDLNQDTEEDQRIEHALKIVNKAGNYSMPRVVEALNKLLDLEFSKLKGLYDLGDAAINVCVLLEDRLIKSTSMKKRMLAFLFHVCEDSIFAINVDFTHIYSTVCDHIVNKIKDPDSCHDPIKEIPQMLNCMLSLNNFIAKHYYLLDASRTTSIIQIYLNMLTANLEDLTVTQLLILSRNPKNEKGKLFPLLYNLKHNGVNILYFFMKNPEIRKFILETPECRFDLVNILNHIRTIFQGISLNEAINFHKKGHRDSMEEVMTLLIKSYDFYLNIFKYYDMHSLFESQNLKVECSMQTMIKSMLKFYHDLFKMEDGLNVLFETLHQNNESAPNPQGARFNHPGFDALSESNKIFFGNFKLYEEKVLNFGEISDLLSLLLRQVQNQIDTKKDLSQDFKTLIEVVIKIPYNKISKTIKKNTSLCSQ